MFRSQCLDPKFVQCKYENRKMNENIILFLNRFVFVAESVGEFWFLGSKTLKAREGEIKEEKIFKTDCSLCLIISNTSEWIPRFGIILFLICDYAVVSAENIYNAC